MAFGRRTFMGIVAGAVLVARPVAADPLPAGLQADLLAKVAGYDRNLRARAGATARVVILTKSGDEDARWAAQVRSALEGKDRIAGLPHTEQIIVAGKLDAVVAQCRADHVAIVLVSASFLGDAAALAAAFDGANVLTAAPDQELAKRGVVLGFELVSGKPRLFLNQAMAARQGVSMSAEVMKLMTVFQ